MCTSRPVPDLARVLAGIVLSLLVWDQQGHSLHILSFFHSPVKNVKFHTGSDLSITFYVVDNPSDGSYIRLTAPLSVRGNRLMCMARLPPSAVSFTQVLLVDDKVYFPTFCTDPYCPSPGAAKNIKLQALCHLCCSCTAGRQRRGRVGLSCHYGTFYSIPPRCRPAALA